MSNQDEAPMTLADAIWQAKNGIGCSNINDTLTDAIIVLTEFAESHSASLAAAVQAEREAIKAHIQLSGNLCYERGERKVAYQLACMHMAMAIDARGPAPAVDVLAVVRKSLASMIARHKRILDDNECDCESAYHSQCGRNDMLREINEAESALRALVSPTTGEGKENA